MTNYSAGHEAEKIAAKFLESEGYEIFELNWKTPVCEVDIIANKQNVIYFVEVKYRNNNSQGMGFDYITPKKLQQMKFAANCWVEENNYDRDYELSGIEMSSDFQITEFIEQIDY
jgi:putative endonuclease